MVVAFLGWSGLPGAEIDFSDQIRPLLSDHCFACHGPDQQHRKAKLRLDTSEGATARTKDDLAAVVPGKPDESELVRRIFSTDPDELMPPPDSEVPQLKPSDRELLRQWIAEGAHYESHWSFTPLPERIPVPKTQAPAPTPIDAFVQAKLERKKIPLAPPAAPERLVRRLAFDLTGLPPTPETVRDFAASPTETAYEALVDKLLDSPAYGERMAAEWLDVARYADSYGYQVDRDRFVWPWRDWVIEAFNKNLPFDTFVTWQLAGDLLPDATREQILATTFNRLHSQKVEGGSVPEEFRIEYVADRTHTFGTAFLGLTLECCRCHDHKYDPVTQKEYYQLTAFFDKLDEAGLYSYFTSSIPTPTLMLTSEEEDRKITEARHAIEELEARLSATAKQAEKDFQTWLTNHPKDPDTPGRIGFFSFDKRENNRFANADDAENPATTSAKNQSVPGMRGPGLLLTGDDAVNTKLGNFARHQPFSVGLWINTPDLKDRSVIWHRSRAWTDAGSRGYQLLMEDGRLTGALIHFWPGNAIAIRTKAQLKPDAWTHVTLTYDGSSKAGGLTLYLDGDPADTEIVQDQLRKNITGGGGDTLTIGERFRDRGFKQGRVDEFQVFERELTPLEVDHIAHGKRLSISLASIPLQRADLGGLRGYYLTNFDKNYKKGLADLAAARQKLNALLDKVEEIMVMSKPQQERQTYFLERGAYDARGEPVEPETPAFLPPLGAANDVTRLDLARWLTRPDHPLTARVTVNRYWQLFFGKGLVKTAEDFGSQGQRPTHEDLLNWLARDFIDHNWNVKRLVKSIVMSAVYRRDSVVPGKARQLDSENLLLASAPRYRWSAEMLRDQALFASGLLVNKRGGPPAKPYEVTASFKPVKSDKGDGLYRRSLYTYWKRTAPAPVMIALDAPRRDVCVARRERTATPLQAFVFMNDPQFVEASRVLGVELAGKHSDKHDALIREACLRLLSREPSAVEQKVFQRLLRQQREHFSTNTEAAGKLLAVGESKAPESESAAPFQAACVVVVNSIMSYDDCVMKR